MALLSLTIACAHAEDKKIVLASTDYPPYCSNSLENQGITAAVVKEAYKKVGYNATIDFLPWGRALMLAKVGKIDGLALIWYSKEREQWFVYSKPLEVDAIIGFYKLKDLKINIDKYDDLQGYRIGYVLDYAYPEGFYKAPLRKQKSYNDEELVKKLTEGSIDLAIIDKLQGKLLLKNKFPKHYNKFEFIDAPDGTTKQFVAISKKTINYQQKIDDFNRGFNLIKKDGTFAKIIKKYQLE